MDMGLMEKELGTKNRMFMRMSMVLASIEGFLALVVSWRLPSEAGSAIFLGFSLERLLFLVFEIALFLVCFALTVKGFLNREWLNDVLEIAERWLRERERAYYGSLLLVLNSISSILILIVYFLPGKSGLDFIQILLQRSWQMLLWNCLLSIHMLAVFTFEMNLLDAHTGCFARHERPTTLLLISITVASIVQWSIFKYYISVLLSIPYWFWAPLGQSEIRGMLFYLLLPIIVGFVFLILKGSSRSRVILLVIFAMGFLFQLGFGALSARGLETLHKGYRRSPPSVYVEYAVDDDTKWSDLLHYDEKFRDDYFLGTKPPGYVSIYLLGDSLSDLFGLGSIANGHVNSLLSLMTYLFPLIAALAVFPLYFIGRELSSPATALLACFLYISCPGFILFTLRLDQVLFPLLFSGGIFLALKAERHKSMLLIACAGAFSYLALYFSFSLIFLPVISILYFGASILPEGGDGKLIRISKKGLVFLGGFMIFAILFRVVLRYDPIVRYLAAMANHSEIMGFEHQVLLDLWTVLLNNVEFSMWIGFSMAALLIGAILRLIFGKPWRWTAVASLFTSFLVSYAFINLLSQTRGEVGRLWLFMLPMVAMFAAETLRPTTSRLPFIASYSVGLNLLTTFYILSHIA